MRLKRGEFLLPPCSPTSLSLQWDPLLEELQVPHVLEFRWKDEHCPEFHIRESDSIESLPVLFGKNLSLEIISGPDCIGYYKNGERHACPHGTKGTKRCADCKQKEGLMVEQFCDGYNLELFSPEDLERINVPHYVYLAFFGTSVYKVGVSSTSRGYLRQIEQGSHYALVIAKGIGGILARQIEKFLTKCGIPDKIHISQKKFFLSPAITEVQAQKILENAFQKYLPSLVFDLPEAKEFILDPPILEKFDQIYHLQNGLNSPKPLHELKLLEGESVSGTVLSVKGASLLLETDTEKILLNTKDLQGYQVNFDKRSPGLHIEEALQGTLF